MTRAGLRALCLLAALACDAHAPSPAATDSAPFQVTITITAECQITSTNDLDFGSHGLISANIDAMTTFTVQCTNTTAYDVGLDAGTGAGATVAARKMTGPGAATITYSLYTDPARSDVWGDTIATDTVPGIGNGVGQTLTVYGRVPPQATPAAGVFSDTITVTVTF